MRSSNALVDNCEGYVPSDYRVPQHVNSQPPEHVSSSSGRRWFSLSLAVHLKGNFLDVDPERCPFVGPCSAE